MISLLAWKFMVSIPRHMGLTSPNLSCFHKPHCPLTRGAESPQDLGKD